MAFLGYESGESSEEVPPGICENYGELYDAIDYIESEVNIANDRNLFNYGKSQIDEAGGVTIESLYSEALKIHRNEQRDTELFKKRETEDRSNHWFKL